MADARHRLLSGFAEHRDALLRFLHRRLNNTRWRRDLAQETWVRAANAQSAAAIDNPRGFLFRIAVEPGARPPAPRRAIAWSSPLLPRSPKPCPTGSPRPENIALHRSELCGLLSVVEGLVAALLRGLHARQFRGAEPGGDRRPARHQPQTRWSPTWSMRSPPSSARWRRQIIVTASHRFASRASNR